MKNFKALVIIDIQNDYFENGANPLEGSQEAVRNAHKLLTYFREQNHLVVYMKHHAIGPGSTFFIPDTPGAEIHTDVMPLKDEPVIIKHFPNSFRKTELLDYLLSQSISDIVFCGMMTHMCVDATVRAAKDFDFNCTLISDACATKALEIQGQKVAAREVQYAFLSALNYYYAEVKTTDEFLDEQ
ncbi:cysteine hydrolase [Marinilabiliaceae bacterium JC017]|nr:cysteine hydrolase [Marinilabiliaceae bacterium JC017]